jgi:hypothetical protein
MRSNKPRGVAKFYTPLPDKKPNQLYVVLEIKEDVDRPRRDIKAFHTGLSFPPINTVLLDDFEVK